MKKFIKSLLFVLLIISAIGGQPVLATDYDFDTDVYNHLEKWDTEFDIDYDKDDVRDVVQKIAQKDDYLSVLLKKIVYERHGDDAVLKVTYKTSKEQEAYVDKELPIITNSIITKSMSDFDKIKAINKYLIDRYAYDESLTSDNVYSALTTGKTTCQGYALTAYKMLKLAGIDNRIITGKLYGGAHGWNLVRLNNKWYHLDITNNDSVGSDKYFLKNDEVFKAEGFTWNTNDYPASNENYNVANNSQSSANNDNKGTTSNLQPPSVGLKSKVDGNWRFNNNLWYFVNNLGGYAAGWNIIDNAWYYLGNDGAMQTGWILYNGKWYYCYPDSGAMAVNTIINGYKVDSSGAWVA